MKILKVSLVASLLIGATSVMAGDAPKPKRTLKNNMMEVYNTLPKDEASLVDAFKNGVFYGRLRSNIFYWDWDNEIPGTNKDNKAHGIGGSIIYKSGAYKGFSTTLGLYNTNNPITSLNMDEADVKYVKAGKDTFSRYNVKTDGDWGMTSLAQAYIQYNVAKTEIKAGRQIFESFLTKSNDTKMIPHTLEGITVVSKDLPQTTLGLAYFDKQKLRDHTTFHDVITFNDGSDNWNNNDDSAVHKGLKYSNFVSAGADVNHDLWVLNLSNKSIKNLKLDLTYGSVPDVVNSLTLEANYDFKLSNGYKLSPGIRHMIQNDDGGGRVGGASLKGKAVAWTDGVATYNNAIGYDDPSSLDSSLTAVRLVLKNDVSKFQIGYSKIADEADIVAPWRGFPTGGYTRAMAQYNWYADTETYDIEAFYNFGKAGILPGFRAMARYAIQDFDEAKQAAGNQADSNILHIDLWQQISAIKGLEAKVRIGLVDADKRLSGVDADSYNEYRFELNYLF